MAATAAILEKGFFQWPAPPLIQDGSHLGFCFRQLSRQRLGQLVRFVCGSLGVTGGMFLSIISAADQFGFRWFSWLEEGFFRWQAPPLIQDGRNGNHLWFGLRPLSDKRLSRLVIYIDVGLVLNRFTYCHLPFILCKSKPQ
jgi:hypothetical protein